jgi:hypothetical protein
MRKITVPLRIIRSISSRGPDKKRSRVIEETDDQPVIISIHALAFQPLVALCENGNVYDLMTLEHLGNPDLFP